MTPRRTTHRMPPARGPLPARLALCAVMSTLLCGLSVTAHAAAGPARGADASAEGGFADFDPSMLSGGAHSAIDLSRFEHGAVVLPGIYNLDLYLNREWVGRLNLRFTAPKPGQSAVPCITHELMDRMGLTPAAATPPNDSQGCLQIGQLIPGASARFDQADLRLDVSVPQAYMHQLPRGYVNPSSWDAGVPAGLLNYNLNTYHTDSNGLSQSSVYLGLNAGINIGAWHLRQQSTTTWQSGANGSPSRRHWNNIATYVQRDLPSLRSTLTLGDSYTDGTVFDSMGLRGAQLGTDDRMLPQSLRGYAPVVHGIAETNAKVTVTQNGVQIYQTSVAPGPFTIDDLYPTGYGGDLRVIVTEADGRTHSFSVPYASVSQLLRAGTTRFDVAFGRLRNLSLSDTPNLIQATAQRGFSNLFTGYAGLQGSQGYAAALIGGAFNTRYGAFAVDLTQAGTTIPGHRAMDGQSIRLSYSKIIPSSGTSLAVAAYRYSSSGFLSLADAVRARDYARRGLDLTQYLPSDLTTIDGVPAYTGLTPAQQAALSGNATSGGTSPVATGLVHRRNHFTLSLNQRLGDGAGALYANASISDYWQRSGSDTQFQVGYNNQFHHVSYNVSATRTRDPQGRYDNQVFVGVSIPLGESSHAPSFTLNYNHDDQAGSQEQAMLNGSLGADNQFTYGVTASHGSNDAGNAGAVNGTYRSRYAVFGASYGKGSTYSQYSFSASGAVVAHPGGVTFGQPTGDTVGIVHAPGAEGARVTNALGVRVDRSGYALVPYMNPYQLNTVRLDPQGLSLGVQLDSTSAQVAPYAGAVVMLDFKTRYGRALIARLHLADGTPVPFGADVVDAQGHTQGVVGQAGLALLRVQSPSGHLRANWKTAQESPHTCRFDYALPADDGHAHPVIDVTCDANPPAPASEGKS